MHYDAERCKDLWGAVFLTAMEDCFRMVPAVKKKGDQEMWQRVIDDARSWALTSRENFITVCDCAGIDPAAARAWFRRCAERGWRRRDLIIGYGAIMRRAR